MGLSVHQVRGVGSDTFGMYLDYILCFNRPVMEVLSYLNLLD